MRVLPGVDIRTHSQSHNRKSLKTERKKTDDFFCEDFQIINRAMNITVLYNATKTLAFASYFCKMRVKIMY